MEGQMMNHWKRLALGLLCAAALPLLSQNSNSSAKPAASAQTGKNSNAQAVQEGDGERKFQQSCSRCHQAPEGFPTHISGTIVRHMRVRASLSQQDERDILRFLNP
jgi:mono/diheme cytochrome c family protein